MRGSQWVAMFGMVDVAVDKMDTIRAIHAVGVADLVGSVDIVDAIKSVGPVDAVGLMGTGDDFDSIGAVCTVNHVNKVGFHGGKFLTVNF